jgi:hypothetical protein
MYALLECSVAAFWLQDIFHWVIVPGFAIFLLHRRWRVSPSDYGLPWPPPMAADLVGLSILVAGVQFLVWFVPRNVVGAIIRNRTLCSAMQSRITYSRVRQLDISLTAGAVESAFFIGLPWLAVRRLVKFPGKASFAIASSIHFALTHWEQGFHNVIATFFFGVIACAWYFKLRDLWPVVVAHTMIDLVAFW